ncbi:D-galactose 1-dehydrogenase [Neoasaia chiangmaiensis NBRC 101099]|uniref:Gfo/Idh/MocA-like oxidoreductase N-terminal domain-containing protein n=2 Tax=Neoasaia chiangmaiensis TaxID=320497 RepID=A0A1U9KSI2_9PROT|nr:hypothetical protein A0U93_12530 [Neoasaia chiangmaiensis]GBR36064.1 D-galactose 1-dehydrogenase [Neoasaia chiangmaiensis NBRC 101099]
MIRTAIVGMGQIARTHHVPAILQNPDFALVAVVDPGAGTVQDTGVRSFPTFGAMLESGIGVDAVAICTPPRVRYAIARTALQHGLHVLLEKPPAQTVGEAIDLAAFAAMRNRTVFGAWHAYFSAGIPVARELIERRGIRDIQIVWRENSEKWHPGTAWFWEAGGYGAFDAGINGISLLQAILAQRIMFRDAELFVRPRQFAPVRANVRLGLSGTDVVATGMFDCGYQGQDETWAISCLLGDDTVLAITDGGACVHHDGHCMVSPPSGQASTLDTEYPAIYRRFASLVADGVSDLDTTPLQIVTDILAFGKRIAQDEPEAGILQAGHHGSPGPDGS